MKGRTQQILMLAAIAVVIYLLCVMNKSSNYSITEKEYSVFGSSATTGPSAATTGMQKGTGLASLFSPARLPPRRISASSHLRMFSRDRTSLSHAPRLVTPETIGGALRNANQQIRADPPNPKQPFVWNNSTITPDTMQRGLCA